MKNFRILFALSLAFLAISCSKSVEIKEFNQFGISFNYPSDWEIDDAEDMGGSVYICVEKEGFNSSGIITIVAVDEEFELEDYLDTYKGIVMSEPVYAGANITPAKEDNFGKYKGISSTVTFSISGLDHKGRITVFSAGGRTYCVNQQEALEDTSKNKEGFRIIEESFNAE